MKFTTKYYEIDGEVSADTIIDGETLYTSLTDKGETVQDGITNVKLRALKANAGVIYLDNISLVGNNS